MHAAYRKPAVLVAALLAVALTACGQSGDDSTQPMQNPPPQQQSPMTTPAPGGQDNAGDGFAPGSAPMEPETAPGSEEGMMQPDDSEQEETMPPATGG